MTQLVHHPLNPIYDSHSQVLILGSFPSLKSREYGFNYAHPQNRFWKIMATIFNHDQEITDHSKFILQNHLALWDVIASCEIIGSSDASIKNVTPNDIAALIRKTKIHTIFTTGQKAFTLYQKYVFPSTGLPALPLPSTSPANAKMKFAELVENYRIIKEKIVYN